MELDIAALAAQGLVLRLDGPRGLARVVELAPSDGVGGRYELDPERHRLVAATTTALVLASLDWPLAAGRVRIEGQAPLEALAVDLTIGRGDAGGTKGEVGVAAAHLPGLEVAHEALGEEPLRIAGLALVDAAYALNADGFALVAASAQADRLRVTVGSWDLLLEGVAADGLKQRRLGGRSVLEIGELTVDHLAATRGESVIRIEGLRVKRLSRKSGGKAEPDEDGLRAAEITLDHVTVERPSGAAERDGVAEGGGADDEKADAPGPSLSALLAASSALDKLNGKIDVDLTADATVPVIGGRRATHHFRLRVDHGAINYYRLEKSLSTLEDALLDFRVEGRELALVVNVPLMKKRLVSWPLPDEEERGLANRHLIRLRRLLDYRLATGNTQAPPKAKADKPREGLALRELRFDGIDIALRWSGGDELELPGGGRVVLGSAQRPAVSDLTLRGGLRHTPGAPTAPPGELDLQLDKLRLALSDVAVGRSRLDVGSWRTKSAELRLGMAGLSLSSLAGEAFGIRLRDLVLR
ncbi:MAG: hypothetical protein R3B72_03300 [Polyangiaceae bacterium]